MTDNESTSPSADRSVPPTDTPMFEVESMDSTDRSRPGSPSMADDDRTVTASAASFGPIIRFGNGRQHVILGTIVVGRAPVAEPGDEYPILIPVDGADGQMSKTHLAVGVLDDQSIWVEDRNSTNGVIVEEPGETPRALPTSERVAVASGTEIRFGGGTSAVVTSPFTPELTETNSEPAVSAAEPTASAAEPTAGAAERSCASCGETVLDGHKFCQHCGTEVNATAAPPPAVLDTSVALAAPEEPGLQPPHVQGATPGPQSEQPVRQAIVSLVEPIEAQFGEVGRWATTGGLAAYFLATLTDGNVLRFVGPLDLLKTVVLLSLIAAIIDAVRPNLAAATGASVGAGFAVGTGLFSLMGGLWWGSGFIQLLIVLADLALLFGIGCFLARSAQEGRRGGLPPSYETLVGGVTGAVFVMSLLMNRLLLDGRTFFWAIGSWAIVLAVIASALIIRSQTSLILAGTVSLLQFISLFGDWYSYTSVAKYLVQVGLLVLAGGAGWQYQVLRTAPEVEHGVATESLLRPESPAPVPRTPADPAPTSGSYASFGARLGAAIVDGLVFSIPTFVLYGSLIAAASAESWPLFIVGFFASIGLSIYLFVRYLQKMSRSGQSWGYSAVGIYLVGRSSCRPISAGAVFGRSMARLISAAPCYLGYFWMIWDPDNQTWHDKMLNTIVVKSLDAGEPGSPS